ncbi:MAG: DUF4037 domain-containing protein [Spirochaetales bacterium]|nr:DUF4037 domain-containing protein [Spirochaetales bacterium]
MKKKVEKISQQIVDIISQWSAVKTITIAEAADEELISPYFFMSIDVYYKGNLLSAKKRRACFGDTATFESSNYGNKDRFLYEDLPIRLEYKNMDRIDTIIDSNNDVQYIVRETGTYLFYRIKNNRVLFQKSGWLNEVRENITNLPDSYWDPMIKTCASSLEHQLGDLSAAVMEDDALFYLRSLAGWINTLCSIIFLMNHEFEPSGRRMLNQLFALRNLPENFKGRFDCLIREDSEFGPERKQEIAKLLTSQIIGMIRR